MIANAPFIGTNRPNRVIVLPPNGPIFGYWLCFIQVLGPNTITVGASQTEAGDNSQGGVADGLQLNQANSSNPAFMFLWRGEMWVSGSAPNTQFVLVIPGQEKQNLPQQDQDCEEP
jgi:hypothetical protein